MEFVALGSLNASSGSAPVQVWICRLWESRNFRRRNELLSVDPIVVDCEDTPMWVQLNSRVMPKFRHHLTFGCIYTITKQLKLSRAQAEAMTLAEIETILLRIGKSLKDFAGMPLPYVHILHQLRNRLIVEEMDYSIDEQRTIYKNYFPSLNTSQIVAYNAIMSSVDNDRGDLIFIQGRGGTGNFFLWNTIISKLRADKKIVLPITSSGIAVLLMPNGRTAHSRFRIPLDTKSDSTCDIRHGTNLGKLLQETSLIIWDEAPMCTRLGFEALDKSLRDILQPRYPNSSTNPFGGLTVVYGGDFRKILHVIKRGSRAYVIDATWSSSYLWHSFKLDELTQNMRLLTPGITSSEAESIDFFDK